MQSMNKEIHPIQAEIVKRLLLVQSARFAELKPETIQSDQFTFHVKQLIEAGVIEKREDGSYHLTPQGKDYANRFDIDSGVAKTEKQGKISVLVIPTRKGSEELEYAMQERLKQPFFGFRGFVTGKIKMGESVIETAARELEEEMGLSGDIEFKTVYHERIYSPSQELLEDKYFFICTAENVHGELIQEFPGGRNNWVKESAVLEGEVFYDIADLLALAKTGSPAFSEKSYTVEGY